MNNFNRKLFILFFSFYLSLVATAFSESACPVDQLGSAICNRVNPNFQNQLDGQLETTVEAVQELSGNSGSAAQLTGQLRNVGLNELTSDIYRYQILLDLMGRLGGSMSDIGSMFQNLNAGGAVQSIFQNTPYPECNFMSGDYRKCVAPFVAQVGWNMDLSDMDNINQMGNPSGIAGQLFGQYNVGQGGGFGLGNLGGISGLLGSLSGANGMGSSLFGMFGNGNMQNGNLLGTIITAIGVLTGNQNLIMAGQVINTLGAMNQNQNAIPGQTQNGMIGQQPTGTSITGQPNYTGDANGTSSVVKGDFSHVTAADLRPHLGSNYTDEDVQAFVDAGREHGIDPRFLASVSKFETGNGTSQAFNDGRNNAMGTSNSSGPIGFGSKRESIFAQAASLSRPGGYYSNANTIGQIGSIYSPPINPSTGRPYANDPNGTNGHWPSSVATNYTQMTNGIF